MGKFLTENLEPKTFTGSAEIAGAFPPPNAVCGLEANEVESAICTDKGNFFSSLKYICSPRLTP